MSQRSTHKEDCTMKVTVPVSLRMKLHMLTEMDDMEFPGEESNLSGLGAPKKAGEEA